MFIFLNTLYNKIMFIFLNTLYNKIMFMFLNRRYTINYVYIPKHVIQ